jgi:hypothetical protein
VNSKWAAIVIINWRCVFPAPMLDQHKFVGNIGAMVNRYLLVHQTVNHQSVAWLELASVNFPGAGRFHQKKQKGHKGHKNHNQQPTGLPPSAMAHPCSVVEASLILINEILFVVSN